MTHLVESDGTGKDEKLDGPNFVSFQQGEQMNTIVKNQRKRIPKRSFAGFGLSTLSMIDDTASRLKKRNRKDDKRWVVDKVDGFTFISAFTLNDFDEYDMNTVKRPLAPTKRKSTSKIESATLVKKVKKPACSTPGILGKSENPVEEGNSTPKKSPIAHGTVPNANEKKNVSPLTKSALVRLKKINVSNLKNKNKQITDIEDSAKSPSSSTKVKSIKLEPGSSNKLSKVKKSNKAPHVPTNKPTLGGAHGPDSQPGETLVIVSDDEDSVELDVCAVDENSSTRFIMSNKNCHGDKNLSDPKKDEKGKPKKKPCRVCCAYPCRIVGAKRIKSRANHFPCFEVSFTSRCQVHTPGEIAIHDSSKGKVNVCIQTTFTDIRMHLDFVRRFPYRAISIVSCQPSLYDDDLKLPENLAPGGNQRCSENHRILEQKRREELHGLYCKLADTLSISKNRASKQWILETAYTEIKDIEAKDIYLTERLNSAKAEYEKKKKRWEELAGKPYVAPEESPAKVESKSKLLELYEKYKQERRQCNYEAVKTEDDSKSEDRIVKNALKDEEKPRRKQNLLRSRKQCHYEAVRHQCNYEVVKTEDNFKSEERKVENAPKEEDESPRRRPNILRARKKKEICQSEKKEENKARILIEGDEKQTGIFPTHLPGDNNQVDMLSNSPVCTPNHTVIPANFIRNPTIIESLQNATLSNQSSLESKNSMSVSANQFNSQTKDTMSASTASMTTSKHPTLGSRQIVHPFQHTLVGSPSPVNPIIPKIDLTEESETSTLKPESLVPKSNQSYGLSQLLVRNPPLPATTNNIRTQVTTPIFQSPPPTQSSAHLQSGTPSTSATTALNAMFPTPIPRKPITQSPTLDSNIEHVIVRVVEHGNKVTIYKIPKTAEGLTLLCKLSAIKKLNPDTIKKIATQFPSNRPQQAACAMSNRTTSASLAIPHATPTQWSTAAPIPNSFPSVSVPSQTSAISANKTINNNSHSSTFQPVKQPTAINSTNANSSGFATISRPIKEPDSGNVATASNLRIPNHHNTTKLRNNSDMSVSEKVKRISAARPCTAVNIDQRNAVSQQQQNKLIFLDLTSKNKPEAKQFSMIPSSSTINVTLNKLGSITANKVFNKSPVPVRSESTPQEANFTPNLVPSTSQTKPPTANFIRPKTLQTKPENANIINQLASLTAQIQPTKASFTAHPARPSLQINQPKVSHHEYHLQRTAPISILPKPKLRTNLPTSVPCASVPTPTPSVPTPTPSVPTPTPSVPISPVPPPHNPSEEPPVDLPEIAPDIPAELTRASFSPLEAIPQISVSLLEDTCQNDAEPGFCVISNVFSLTDDTASSGSSEKKTDAAVVATKVDTNVSTAVEASMVASSHVQSELANIDLQNRQVNKDEEIPNVLGSSCASNTNDDKSAEQLKPEVSE